MLVSCSSDLSIKIWNVDKDYQCVKTMRGHEHNVSRVTFLTNNCDTVISCSRDNTVKFWEVRTGFCTHTINDQDSWVRALAVKCDGEEVSLLS